LGFYSESIDIWGIGLINAFSKFGDEFFKKDKKLKGTFEEDDSSDSEEDHEDREQFVNRVSTFI
jgi:hypothetical protein